MKGKYLTPEGKEVEVVSFDEANKMVYIEKDMGQYKWVHENEYSLWQSSEQVAIVDEVEEEAPEPTTSEEQPKKKRTVKKKAE